MFKIRKMTTKSSHNGNLEQVSDTYYLSIIIPAYNKELVIGTTLRKIIEFLNTQDYRSEIIVIDDASNDSTVEKIKQIINRHKNIRLLINDQNMEKGATVKRGILNARGKYVVFLDADYAFPIDQVNNFLNQLENGADIVIGNRVDPDTTYLVKPSCFHYIYQRFLIGRMFNLLVRLLFLKDIKDTQCGIKGFRTDLARAIFGKMTVTNFAFDVEILYIVQQNREKIVQIPVTYDYIDEPSSVQLFRDSLAMLKSLIKIRINDWHGRYRLGGL